MGDIALTQQYIRLLQNAHLHSDGLPESIHQHLSNPPQVPESIDPALEFSLGIYLDTRNSPDETFNRIRARVAKRYNDTMDSSKKMEKTLFDLTGVAAKYYDMCIDGCVGFTGPLANHECCPTCGKSRYDEAVLQSSGGRIKKPQQQFSIPLLGPQLQA
ncbi:hypothetical protein K488DRAFT_64052, partial [Vararia minispora EC-137]